ncbi:hypothetical protein [Streptomyces sp. NPDC016845]
MGGDPRTGRVVTTVPEPGLEDLRRPPGAYKLVGGGICGARWWLPV